MTESHKAKTKRLRRWFCDVGLHGQTKKSNGGVVCEWCKATIR